MGGDIGMNFVKEGGGEGRGGEGGWKLEIGHAVCV